MMWVKSCLEIFFSHENIFLFRHESIFFSTKVLDGAMGSTSTTWVQLSSYIRSDIKYVPNEFSYLNSSNFFWFSSLIFFTSVSTISLLLIVNIQYQILKFRVIFEYTLLRKESKSLIVNEIKKGRSR